MHAQHYHLPTIGEGYVGDKSALSNPITRKLAAEHEVSVRKRLAAGTRPKRGYPQDCWYRAWLYALDHPDEDGIRLVHGHFRTYGTPIGHAWVAFRHEGHAIVFGGVAQRFYDRGVYYETLACTAEARYTARDAAGNMLRASKLKTRAVLGPWHVPGGYSTLAELPAHRPGGVAANPLGQT